MSALVVSCGFKSHTLPNEVFVTQSFSIGRSPINSYLHPTNQQRLLFKRFEISRNLPKNILQDRP